MYNPTLTANTSCVAPGSVNRFTATITNSSSSNQPLGSALFHSNKTNGFTNISFRSFTRPDASGGKRWQALPDLLDADGVFLRAASASQSLQPGESVTFSFQAKAPSSLGDKTWVTNAWQSTLFLSGRFTLATSNPVVNVDTSCPATFPNGGTVTTDTPGTKLEVVPNTSTVGRRSQGSRERCRSPRLPRVATIRVFFDDPNPPSSHPPFCKGVGENQVNPVPDCFSDFEAGVALPCIESQFVNEAGHLADDAAHGLERPTRAPLGHGRNQHRTGRPLRGRPAVTLPRTRLRLSIVRPRPSGGGTTP